MNLRDYFESDVFSFPGDCGTQDIRDYLGSRYDHYLSYLSSINTTDDDISRLLQERETIADTAKLVLESIDNYYLGHPNKAFTNIGKAISKVRKYFLGLSGDSEIGTWINRAGLYRIRLSKLHDLRRQDLFHVPFELRSRLRTQRYSIPGLPCLYMGSSIYVCWEELGRPDLQSVHISRLECMKATKLRIMTIGPTPARVLDHFREGNQTNNKNIDRMATNAALLLAICWPIILACSLRVNDEGASFKSEYIIPQLVLQWVSSQENVDGVQYPSLHVDHHKVDSRLTWNYAFPARTSQNRTGYCSTLSKWFRLTEPLSWAVAEVVRPSFDINSELIDHPFYIAPGITTKYGETEFGRIQALLSKQQTEVVELEQSRSNMSLELTP